MTLYSELAIDTSVHRLSTFPVEPSSLPRSALFYAEASVALIIRYNSLPIRHQYCVTAITGRKRHSDKNQLHEKFPISVCAAN